MKDFDKAWSKAQDALSGGEKEFCFYGLSEGRRLFTVGSKGIEPHTLLIYWQVGDNILFRGFFNGVESKLSEESNKEKCSIKIIVNSTNKKNIEILTSTEELKFLYSQKANDDELVHKLIVFHENMYFSEIMLYDSQTGISPSRIMVKEKTSCKQLRNIALSILGKHDSRVYKLVSESEV